jgi:hypothetical protein
MSIPTFSHSSHDKAATERAFGMQDAVAAVMLEGFKPGAAFLADAQAVVDGTLSPEDGIERARARAHALEASA